MRDLNIEEIDTLSILVSTEINETEQCIKNYSNILDDKVIGYLRGNMNNLILLKCKLETNKREIENEKAECLDGNIDVNDK